MAFSPCEVEPASGGRPPSPHEPITSVGRDCGLSPHSKRRNVKGLVVFSLRGSARGLELPRGEENNPCCSASRAWWRSAMGVAGRTPEVAANRVVAWQHAWGPGLASGSSSRQKSDNIGSLDVAICNWVKESDSYRGLSLLCALNYPRQPGTAGLGQILRLLATPRGGGSLALA
jgi:hypothetical protein